MESSNKEVIEDSTLKTEVTSIAQEELKTGVKIQTPTAEDLVARASIAFFRNRKMFSECFSNLSGRGRIRVMNAVLDLPVDGVPVYLKDDDEKLAFAIGQRVISDRFIITQHHIIKEVKAQRAAQAVQVSQDEANIDKNITEEKTLDNSNNKS